METKEKLLRIIGQNKIDEIDAFITEMEENSGVTSFSHNQVVIAGVPEELSVLINRATGGYLEVAGKRFAIEASKLLHEIRSHSDKNKEISRGQISYGIEEIYEIIETMIDPDYIEDVSHGDVMDPRNVFAAVRKKEGYVIVVLSVGGKRNPNITPQQIVYFTEQKWQTMKADEKTIREMIYAGSRKRDSDDSEMIQYIKKNRVTVAHHES